VHLPPAPWPPRDELRLKRVLGYINWKRSRERITDFKTLALLVDDMHSQRPDHVAVTGDIVNLALKSEFAAARAWLNSLGAPRDVSFVPGNHDAYVREALKILNSAFVPWTSDAQADEKAAQYPFLRVRGEVAVIGVSSGVPTGLFMATGRIGAAQIGRLRAILADCRTRGLIRVVLVHHAPVPWQSPMRRLVDAGEMSQALAQEGAELVLHGHHHKRMVNFIASPNTQTEGGKIPVVGAPAGSILLKDEKHRAAYHLVHLARRGDKVAVNVRARGPAGVEGEIAELAPVLKGAPR